jgi:hypothetical protein
VPATKTFVNTDVFYRHDKTSKNCHFYIHTATLKVANKRT